MEREGPCGIKKKKKKAHNGRYYGRYFKVLLFKFTSSLENTMKTQ